MPVLTLFYPLKVSCVCTGLGTRVAGSLYGIKKRGTLCGSKGRHMLTMGVGTLRAESINQL